MVSSPEMIPLEDVFMSDSDLPSPPTSFTQPPNSTMAIVSLVAGILGWTFVPVLGSIVAVITGHMAQREIRESGGRLGGDSLATVGLVLGYISLGLGLIGICVTLFFLALFPIIFGFTIFESSGSLPMILLAL